MRVSTIFTLDRMDFNAISQKNTLSTKLPLPESFACLFDPQRIFGNPLRTFRQSFASRFLQNRDFSCYSEISVPITQGPLGCLLGFILGDPGAVSGGRKKSKQARKNSGKEKSRTRKRALLLFSFLTFLRPNFFSLV